MIRDLLRTKPLWRWLAEALALAFILWAGYVGTVTVFVAVTP